MRLFRARPSDHDARWNEQASAWLDGELSGEERRTFEQHRAGCALCEARLAGYRGLTGRLKSSVTAVRTPSPQPIFAATRDRRHRRAYGGLRPRLTLVLSAAALIAGGISTPAVRAAMGGAVQYAGCATGAACAESFAGDRVYFHAVSGSVLAVAEPRLSLYSGAPAAGSLSAAGGAFISSSPVYGLAGGRVLYRGAAGGWLSAQSAGGDQRPFPLDAGMSVVDVSSAGDRLLVRRTGSGGASTEPPQVQVLDQNGAVTWRAADAGVAADIEGISPDGTLVLGVSAAGVQEISLADGSVAATIPLGGRVVERPQISADGSRMAFLQPADASPKAALSVAFVQLKPEFQEPQTWPVRDGTSATFRLSPDGNWLALNACYDRTAAACASGAHTTLQVWDLSSRTSQTVAGFDDAAVGALAWSADSGTLLIQDQREGAGHLWLRAGSGRTDALAVPGSVAAAAWLPSGSVVALSDGGRAAGSLAIQRSGSGEQARLLSSEPLAPRFSRDGSVLALLPAGAPPDLVSKRGARPAQIQQNVQELAWSPDGSRAVAISNGEAYLWRRGAGLAATPFGSGKSAGWSHDGRQLAVSGDGGAALFDRDGAHLNDLPADVNPDSWHWSPAAQRLAGIRTAGGSQQLVLVDPTTGAETALASAAHVEAFAWSTDGRQLAYTAAGDAASPLQLRTVDAAGGHDAFVAQLAGNSASLAWQGSAGIVYIDPLPGETAARPVVVSLTGGAPVVLDLAVTALTQGPGG